MRNKILLMMAMLLLSGCSSDQEVNILPTGSYIETEGTTPVVVELTLGIPQSTENETTIETTTATEPETTAPEILSPAVSEGGYGELLPGEVLDYGEVVLAGNAAYFRYGYLDEVADRYTGAVNYYGDVLAGKSRVFSMVVPGNSLIMPQEYKNQVNMGNLEGDIEKIYSRMNANVIPVKLCDRLKEHMQEYLYYRTDHHWTQLGAYYAYSVFCESKGFNAPPLSSYQTTRVDGFLGSSYYTYLTLEALSQTPDFVRSFFPRSNSTLELHKNSGEIVDWPIINDASKFQNTNLYLCYIGGDNPYGVITNHDKADGSACLIVKDSFGNALVPFLADDYNYVYIVDYRYYNGGLLSVINEHGIQDVIFENAMSLADDNATAWLIGAAY